MMGLVALSEAEERPQLARPCGSWVPSHGALCHVVVHLTRSQHGDIDVPASTTVRNRVLFTQSVAFSYNSI